jgi:hypothetical protein
MTQGEENDAHLSDRISSFSRNRGRCFYSCRGERFSPQITVFAVGIVNAGLAKPIQCKT